MMPTQLTILAVLLAALAGTGWLAYHQTEQRAVAEARIKDAQDAGDAWRLALDEQTAYAKAQAEKLATSSQGYEALRKTTDKRIRAYEQAARADGHSADWDHDRVPAAVAQRLCDYFPDPGEAGLPADPQAVHGPDQGACPGADRYFTNGDMWRWVERMLEVIDRMNQDRAAISNAPRNP